MSETQHIRAKSGTVHLGTMIGRYQAVPICNSKNGAIGRSAYFVATDLAITCEKCKKHDA